MIFRNFLLNWLYSSDANGEDVRNCYYFHEGHCLKDYSKFHYGHFTKCPWCFDDPKCWDSHIVRDINGFIEHFDIDLHDSIYFKQNSNDNRIVLGQTVRY